MFNLKTPSLPPEQPRETIKQADQTANPNPTLCESLTSKKFVVEGTQIFLEGTGLFVEVKRTKCEKILEELITLKCFDDELFANGNLYSKDKENIKSVIGDFISGNFANKIVFKYGAGSKCSAYQRKHVRPDGSIMTSTEVAIPQDFVAKYQLGVITSKWLNPLFNRDKNKINLINALVYCGIREAIEIEKGNATPKMIIETKNYEIAGAGSSVCKQLFQILTDKKFLDPDKDVTEIKNIDQFIERIKSGECKFYILDERDNPSLKDCLIRMGTSFEGPVELAISEKIIQSMRGTKEFVESESLKSFIMALYKEMITSMRETKQKKEDQIIENLKNEEESRKIKEAEDEKLRPAREAFAKKQKGLEFFGNYIKLKLEKLFNNFSDQEAVETCFQHLYKASLNSENIMGEKERKPLIN